MMDPNLFHLDWERALEALAGIVVLSFFVERACALLFESRWWIRLFEDARVGEQPPEAGATGAQPAATAPRKLRPGRKYPLKEILGFLVALAICLKWNFDAVSIVLLSEHTRLIGVLVTAAIVAGGSKASIALFQDVLHVSSAAKQERKTLKDLDKNQA
jgi:hypothetical protein